MTQNKTKLDKLSKKFGNYNKLLIKFTDELNEIVDSEFTVRFGDNGILIKQTKNETLYPMIFNVDSELTLVQAGSQTKSVIAISSTIDKWLKSETNNTTIHKQLNKLHKNLINANEEIAKLQNSLNNNTDFHFKLKGFINGVEIEEKGGKYYDGDSSKFKFDGELLLLETGRYSSDIVKMILDISNWLDMGIPSHKTTAHKDIMDIVEECAELYPSEYIKIHVRLTEILALK